MTKDSYTFSDWALDAAGEILRNKVTNQFDMRDIINKHCYAAPRGSYRLFLAGTGMAMKSNTTYIPVPRCETCRHWTQIEKTGCCDQFTNFYTPSDFGCVQWENKP